MDCTRKAVPCGNASGRPRKGAWGILSVPQRYCTAGAGPGAVSRREINQPVVLSHSPNSTPPPHAGYPKAKPSSLTERCGGEGPGDPPLTCRSLGTPVWPLRSVPMPSLAPSTHTYPTQSGEPIASSEAAGLRATALLPTAASGS